MPYQCLSAAGSDDAACKLDGPAAPTAHRPTTNGGTHTTGDSLDGL
jgi:hypothetical protein